MVIRAFNRNVRAVALHERRAGDEPQAHDTRLVDGVGGLPHVAVQCDCAGARGDLRDCCLGQTRSMVVGMSHRYPHHDPHSVANFVLHLVHGDVNDQLTARAPVTPDGA